MSGETKGRKASTKPVEPTETRAETAPQSPETAPPAPPTVPQTEPEIVVADVYPDFAASPEEVTRRTAMLRDYVKNHMTENEDFGVIAGGSKPSLWKPGAEKLIAVFGLAPIVEVVNRVENWDDGFVSYEMKVTLLNKRTGGVEAEGIGSCNSRERRYKNQDAAGIANTVLKMAKKRALVDATLSATRASGMFTQDLEDMEFEPDRGSYAPPRANRPAPRASDGDGRDEAPQREASGGDGLTDPQMRTIMAIAGKVFGRHSRDHDLDRMVGKPLDQLTKREASALIDELKAMQEESEGGGEREMSFSRAGSRNSR